MGKYFAATDVVMIQAVIIKEAKTTGERTTVKQEICVVPSFRHPPWVEMAEQRSLGMQEPTATSGTIGYLTLMSPRVTTWHVPQRTGSEKKTLQ